MAASALQPVLKHDYAYFFEEFMQKTTNLLSGLMRSKALRKQADLPLRSFWESHWVLGQMALLATMDGARGFSEEYARSVSRNLLELFRWGETALCMRALWGLARMGKTALPYCRERLRTAVVEMDWIGAVLGIAIIGMRHKKLAAETSKILKSPPRPERGLGNADLYYDLAGEKVLDVIRPITAEPKALDGVYLGLAKMVTDRIAKSAQAGPPYDFENENDVQDELARAVSVSREFDLRPDNDCIFRLAAPMWWLAECEAEELYPPKRWVDLVRERWTRDMTFKLVEQARAYWGKPEPVKARPEPGRNEPCPCGSGKKYKKCCLGAPRER
jgi:hypothetical protein